MLPRRFFAMGFTKQLADDAQTSKVGAEVGSVYENGLESRFSLKAARGKRQKNRIASFCWQTIDQSF